MNSNGFNCPDDCMQHGSTSKKTVFFWLAAIVLFHIINGVVFLRAQSLTADEPSFYEYAVRFLQGKPDRIYPASDNSKMPVTVLNTLPRVAEHLLHPQLRKTDGGFSDILNGRYVSLLISVLILLLVYLWASQLYSKRAGLFAAFLYSVCPNCLSNAGLVTTDIYSVFFWCLRFIAYGNSVYRNVKSIF